MILPGPESWGPRLLLHNPPMQLHSDSAVRVFSVGGKFDLVVSILITCQWLLILTDPQPLVNTTGQIYFGIQSFSDFGKITEWINYILYNTAGNV